MEKGPNSLSAFMRGGQYLAHIGHMVVQNIARGLILCLIIAFIIGSYFYIKKLDGYDKYVISTEIAAVTRAVIPVADEANKTHFIDLYGPVEENQKYHKVLLNERRLLPWYEAERYKTMKKIKAGIWIVLLDSVILMILLSVLSSYLGRIITKDKQTRGARIVTKRELIREVRAFNKVEKDKTDMKDYRPYNIEEVEYPLRSETQHTLLVGSTGTGKTQLLLRLLRQVHDRNDRAIIYDKMRSFVPMFYNPETDFILNPLDNRCPPWDIFSDARNIVEWNSIADAIIQSDDTDDYWVKGAKSIFANTADRLQQQSKEMKKRPRLTDLMYLLTQTSIEDLHEFLIGTEAARHINPKADKQSASMISTLSQSLTCLGFLKDSTEDNPGFSIRRWMADDSLKGKLFLTSRDDQHSTIQPLLTMWMSLCTTSLMSQDRSNDRLCWFFIDELPSLNKLPDLEAGLAQARQYGGAYILGIQVESQLQSIYDEKGARSIMGLTLNKAIFNPGDNQTAKVMADSIGKKELMRRNEGISLGANRIRDGVSVNSQITLEHIVLPEELMDLPNLNFYLKMRGALPTAKLEMKYILIENIHEGFIEDMYFIDRYNHKMSNDSSADAAKKIIEHISKTKGAEPKALPVAAPQPVATPVTQTAAPSAKYIMTVPDPLLNQPAPVQTPHHTVSSMMTVDAGTLDPLTGKVIAPHNDMRSSEYIAVETYTQEDYTPSESFIASLSAGPDVESPMYNDSVAPSPVFDETESDPNETLVDSTKEEEDVAPFDIFAQMGADEEEEPTDTSDQKHQSEEQRETRSTPDELTREKEIAPPPPKQKPEPELTRAEIEKAQHSTRVHNAKSREGSEQPEPQKPAGLFGKHGSEDRGR